ncbi:MAG: hypothetical protein WAO08_37050, partial [Hyphomicrobiaceae bacterium]
AMRFSSGSMIGLHPRGAQSRPSWVAAATALIGRWLTAQHEPGAWLYCSQPAILERVHGGTLAMLVRVAVAIVLWLLPTTLPAQEPPRLALLMGNQGYVSKVGPLKNPHNDVISSKRR